MDYKGDGGPNEMSMYMLQQQQSNMAQQHHDGMGGGHHPSIPTMGHSVGVVGGGFPHGPSGGNGSDGRSVDSPMEMGIGRRTRSGGGHYNHHNHSEGSNPMSPGGGGDSMSLYGGSSMGRHSSGKRTIHDWERVMVFEEGTTTQDALQNFENCQWTQKNKSTTREGFKAYFGCREASNCPALVYLLFEANSSRVILFRNQEAHDHVLNTESGNRTRGVPRPIQNAIREMFNHGVTKPRKITLALKRRGLPEVPRIQLANFLSRLRREASMASNDAGSNSNMWLGRSGIEEEDFMDSPYNKYMVSEMKEDGTAISPIFPCNVVATPAGESSQSHPNVGRNMYDNSTSGGMVAGSQGQGPRGSGPSGPGNFHGAEIGERSGSEVSSQSGVVSSTPAGPYRNYNYRDESFEDGEQLLANEDNVKESILQHLKQNYSNRDMLHIREELRALKRENKYVVLNRLLSFTAGFLQDTFLEERANASD